MIIEESHKLNQRFIVSVLNASFQRHQLGMVRFQNINFFDQFRMIISHNGKPMFIL